MCVCEWGEKGHQSTKFQTNEWCGDTRCFRKVPHVTNYSLVSLVQWCDKVFHTADFESELLKSERECHSSDCNFLDVFEFTHKVMNNVS